MATRIRLQRHGRKKRPFYYIVVADTRSKRDGRFIDRIGDYNPLTQPAAINLDFDKAFEWIMEGAQPSNTCKKILSYKGVLYKKHLARGVRKGALTEEEMEKKMQEWLDNKAKEISKYEEKLAKSLADAEKARQEAETKKREEYAKKLEEAATPPVEESEETPATEEVTDTTQEEAPTEETPAEEDAKEEVKEEPKEETEETPAEEKAEDKTEDSE